MAQFDEGTPTVTSQPQRSRAIGRVNALGAFVAQRLDDLKMSRTAFSVATGMSRSSVYRLLGDEPPERVSVERLERIAEILDVEPDALAGLWDGHVYAAIDPDREDIVRSFVLATGDLSLDELRRTLDVARAAVQLVRGRSE